MMSFCQCFGWQWVFKVWRLSSDDDTSVWLFQEIAESVARGLVTVMTFLSIRPHSVNSSTGAFSASWKTSWRRKDNGPGFDLKLNWWKRRQRRLLTKKFYLGVHIFMLVSLQKVFFLFTLVPDMLKDKCRESLHEEEQNKYVWANE